MLVYELVSTDMSGVQCSKKGLGERRIICNIEILPTPPCATILFSDHEIAGNFHCKKSGEQEARVLVSNYYLVAYAVYSVCKYGVLQPGSIVIWSTE